MSGYRTPRSIRDDDDVAGFDSGELSLDAYLRSRALANHAEGASRTFVTCHGGRVIGFYSLAAASVERRSAAGRIRRNMPEPVPVILLSRLAIDRSEHGKGLGRHLLRDAILRSVRAADPIGVRALLVHAVSDEARSFYLHFGFESSPTDPLHLLLLIRDARAAISSSAPPD